MGSPITLQSLLVAAKDIIKDHVKKHPVIYGVITALFFATLFLTGVMGSFALIGGHAAWAPHFMSAMNTAISGAWSGLPYAMTAAGGVGGTGLIGTAIMAIIGGKKWIASRKPIPTKEKTSDENDAENQFLNVIINPIYEDFSHDQVSHANHGIFQL